MASEKSSVEKRWIARFGITIAIISALSTTVAYGNKYVTDYVDRKHCIARKLLEIKIQHHISDQANWEMNNIGKIMGIVSDEMKQHLTERNKTFESKSETAHNQVDTLSNQLADCGDI